MLSPARPVNPSAPDQPTDPHRGGEPPAHRNAGRARRLVLVLGLVAALAALAFPFAPVHQPQVDYGWQAGDGPAAIPLMPYQPQRLTATIDCAAARGSRGGLLLSTVPPRPDPAAAPLAGLLVTGSAAGLQITSAGVELGAVALPGGPCAVTVVSDPARTVVSVDGVAVLTRDGDVRPDVAGAFTDARSGVELTLRADTRFQTSISALKAALGAVSLLALLGMLAALGATDRAARPVRPRLRLTPRRWWRPRVVDLAVTATLTVWLLIGAITVDDGYIAGIVRSRGSNGFIGNVYRWLNAPEAPFSWIYELTYRWSLISSSTLWMRLPSALLGLACWLLLSRLVLPRLGRMAGRRATPWLAALALLTWWVPLNLGLRPEPWVAVGTLGVFCAVERALATRRVLPLACALLLAGVVTALTPGGLMAFAPLLAAAVPLLRLLLARRDLHLLPLLAVLVAAPAPGLLLMVADQSLAGLLEAVRVRALIGGGLPWYQEVQRYAALMEQEGFQGAIGRRAAVLATLLAAAGALWAGPRGGAGIANGPVRRLVVGFLVALATMTVTPTKWTQHFGDLAGYGAAVLTVGLAVGSAAVLRRRPAAFLAAVGAVTVAAALVLSGRNSWPYLSSWFTPSFSTLPPQLAGVPVATIALVAGAALTLTLAGRSAWHRAAGKPAPAPPRRAPSPAALLVLVLTGVLVLQVGTLARVALTHHDSYTPASDAVATLRGEPCGLQRLLSVETDPVAGLLPPASGRPATAATLPVDVGGRTLPGLAVSGHASTPWSALDPAQRAGELPVVVTVSGTTRPGDGLFLEFGAGERVLQRRRVEAASPQPRDVREMAPPGADTVRLRVEAATTGSRVPAVASLPRVPRLTPMTELLPPGSSAVLDWPVAFVVGCLIPEPLPLGTAGLPRWRVGPPQEDPAAEITYAPGFGGPFAVTRLLVTEQRMATYLRGDPTRDAAQVYRWTPIESMARPRPTVSERTVAGWHADGHARVPGLDPVG